MKKFLKTIILLPMFPLIWHQLGFGLDMSACDYGCDCGYKGCCERAKAMVRWWRR